MHISDNFLTKKFGSTKNFVYLCTSFYKCNIFTITKVQQNFGINK